MFFHLREFKCLSACVSGYVVRSEVESESIQSCESHKFSE